METTQINNDIFQLRPNTKDSQVAPGRFKPGRSLIGRSESCDFVIAKSFVSSVHAVIEVSSKGAKIYDMNSKNGTYVNGQKVVVKELRPGDKVTFGNLDFTFEPYAAVDDFPLVLPSLDPKAGSASVFQLPQTPQTPRGQKDVPVTPPISPEQFEKEDVPYIVYPLSTDPNADYSEYIFEDADVLYPIFKYDHSRAAVEVIILHNDRVYSVDYLPESNTSYKLVGANSKKNSVEFPYLGKSEEVPFIDMQGNRCTVRNINRYEMLVLADNDIRHVTNEIQLQANDIVKLTNGNLEIYVRKVAAPPKVKAAPFFGRDKKLRNLVFLVLLLTLGVSVGISSIKRDPEEVKKETDPERLAKILYKSPSFVKPVEKVVVPPKEEPKKEVVKKVEPKPVEEKKQEVSKAPEVAKDPSPTPKPVPKPEPIGAPKAEKVQQVKKANNPAPKTAMPTAKPATEASGGKVAKAATTNANTNLKTRGPVDTFKSNFSSNMSSLLAKGGNLSGATTSTGQMAVEGVGSRATIGGGLATGVKKANARAEIGSLTGAASGKLAETKGVEGIGGVKKGFYTAGIPTDTVVLGSMDPDEIRRILREHIPQFRYCYQQELDKNPGAKLSDVVRTNFQIGASGHVTRAAIESRLPTHVKSCVASVLKGIAFPQPKGGGVVEVRQPLNFYPASL